MRTRLASPFLSFLVSWAIVSLASLSPAGAQLPEPLAALAREADLVVLGECASEHAEWNADSFIATTIELRIHRVFKGEVTPLVAVKTLGGTLDGETVSASHGATLAAGERVVLFLKRSAYGPYYVIAGGEQGRVVIDDATPWSGAPVTASMDDLAQLLRHEAGR
jgi:hypothetical protein